MAILTLSIDIPDSKIQRSKDRFLAVAPNEELVEGTEDKLYTDKEWFEECIKGYLRKVDAKGKRRLAEINSIDNEDMFIE